MVGMWVCDMCHGGSSGGSSSKFPIYISTIHPIRIYNTRTSWHAFMGHGELRVTPQPPNRVCVDELRAAARRRVLARRRRRMLLEQARGEER